jgi:mRNA interferase RelE/StbE
VPQPAPYETLLHPEFEDDLRRLPKNMQARVLDAVADRLGTAPDRYGQRLRQSLHGYWKLRVGDYRVVYELVGRTVRVYGVMHRRDVYARIESRAERKWPRRRE